MKKFKGLQKWSICVGIIVIVMLGSVIIWKGTSDNNAYRTIRVMEVSGENVVIRDGKDTIAVYENMNLQPGDRLCVGGGGYVRLVLDDEKYVYIEEASEVAFVSEGTGRNKRVRAEIIKGELTEEVEIEATDASEEYMTPVSTMAIRGNDKSTEPEVTAVKEKEQEK